MVFGNATLSRTLSCVGKSIDRGKFLKGVNYNFFDGGHGLCRIDFGIICANRRFAHARPMVRVIKNKMQRSLEVMGYQS